MKGRTRGHQLFESWLISEHSPDVTATGRPRFEALQTAVNAMQEHQAKVMQATVPKNAVQLYHYLSSSGDGVLRTPRAALRLLIELLTRGTVPREAWDQPADNSSQSAA